MAARQAVCRGAVVALCAGGVAVCGCALRTASADGPIIMVTVPDSDGRALVLPSRIKHKIESKTIEYNAAAGKGRVTVCFKSQVDFAEARKYAKSIIEDVINDKNTVMTSGEKPPPGKYESLNENLQGNVLEMEFHALN